MGVERTLVLLSNKLNLLNKANKMRNPKMQKNFSKNFFFEIWEIFPKKLFFGISRDIPWTGPFYFCSGFYGFFYNFDLIDWIFEFLILFADKKSNLSPLNFYKNPVKIEVKVGSKFLRGTSYDKQNFRVSKNFLSKDVPFKNFGSTLKSILDIFVGVEMT